jgi:hypothetical protein
MAHTIGRSIGLLLTLAASVVSARTLPERPVLQLSDVEGRLVNPFGDPNSARPIVLVFVSSDCPMSNRYAPELKRLFGRFGAVRFWLVYPNPADGPAMVRRHLAAYSLPIPALLDPAHVAARRAGVKMTPEAAVFDALGRLVYRGRIDDRFLGVGVERPVVVHHDLEDAIVATLTNDSPAVRTTDAVGCYLADMAP